MRNAVFAATVILSIASGTAGAYAGSDPAKPSQASSAEEKGLGLPHILNDLPWGEVCPANHALCDTTGSVKPEKRNS